MALAAAGCTVPNVDLEGRPCPCLSGWQCDESSQTCIREASETSSGVAEGSGSSGEASTSTSEAVTTEPAETTESPASEAFEVLAFSADWSTPQSVHWVWELAGDEADFRAYELWVATSAEALTGEDVLVFDREVNPELGRFSLANTNRVDLVVATISDGLLPGTEYYGQLHVLDTAGGRSVSPNVAVRPTTAEPTSSLTIFSDDDPFSPGSALPGCLARSEVAPSEGTHHFELTLECSSEGDPVCAPTEKPELECFENLRLQNLERAEATIGGGDFAEAFVELDVAIVPPDDNPAHGWWSDISIQHGGMWPGARGITLRADGMYRRYQIPLVQMGLTPDTFDGFVTGVRVGSKWRRGAVVRFDEVRLRW